MFSPHVLPGVGLVVCDYSWYATAWQAVLTATSRFRLRPRPPDPNPMSGAAAAKSQNILVVRGSATCCLTVNRCLEYTPIVIGWFFCAKCTSDSVKCTVGFCVGGFRGSIQGFSFGTRFVPQARSWQIEQYSQDLAGVTHGVSWQRQAWRR